MANAVLQSGVGQIDSYPNIRVAREANGRYDRRGNDQCRLHSRLFSHLLRPTKTPQRYHLFTLMFAQDIAHADRG
jgi:hypothetical protein